MRRIGEVRRTTGAVAIVRSSDDYHPSIGEPVVDETLDTVGRVVDVMGPVDRPYVVVNTDDPPTDLLNRRLYIR